MIVLLSKRVNSKIFEKIKNHQNVNMREQSIRNAISAIHKNYPGVTLNAAAQIFAESKGFSIFRSLSHEDKLSLGNFKHETKTRTIVKPLIKEIKLNIENGNDISLPNNLAKDAIKMSEKVYPRIYVLENSLRKLIVSQLNKYGNWWENKVPSEIKKMVTSRQLAEGRNRWHSIRGTHEIYYTDFGDIISIITNNWNDFKDLFPSQDWIRTRLDEIELSRNIIAHNNPLPETEIHRLKLYFDDFKKQLKTRR